MPEISLEEAVSLTGRSERTVRSYIKKKKLLATKVGGKWFVDLESTRKLVGNIPENTDDNSGLPSGSSDFGVENLVCFRLASEVFNMPVWSDRENSFWSDLESAKNRFFYSLGAGYYSYGNVKLRHYSEARAALGGAIALVCATGPRSVKADIRCVEQKLIPALTSLIKKMERKDSR